MIEIADEAQRFADFLRRMPAEERDAIARREVAEALGQHREFKAALAEGKCYLCGGDFAGFDAREDCLHWLARPAGVRKKQIEAMLLSRSMIQVESYLRWLANADAKGRNINDLTDESSVKLVERTFKFRNIEWAISLGEGDFAGHKGARVGAAPHYHFQMKVDGHHFIGFNDFHLPLSRSDAVTLAAARNNADMKIAFPGGEGMSALFEHYSLGALIDLTVSDRNDEEAVLGMSTIIMAEDGSTLSGEHIYDMIKRAKEEGRTFASVAREVENANVRTIITPGPGVVEMAERSGGRGKKRPKGD